MPEVGPLISTKTSKYANIPDPSWIPGDPAFWKSDNLRALPRSFSNKGARLVDGGVEVEPHGLSLGDGNPYVIVHRSVHGAMADCETTCKRVN